MFFQRIAHLEMSVSGYIDFWDSFACPFQLQKELITGSKRYDFDFYNKYHMNSNMTREATEMHLCLHKESIWMRAGINQVFKCLEFINTDNGFQL